MSTDFAIIGGGVVGLSLAWGLLKQGYKVTILDGGDGSFRASRGNFGLVWVQSKGLNAPHYARWNQMSAALWGDFARELAEATGQSLEAPLGLEQKGGYDYHFSEESLRAQLAKYEALKEALGGDYPYEVLRGNEIRVEEPSVGPEVHAAILHHQDGHVNPLKLLHALSKDVQRLGGLYLPNRHVESVTKSDQFKLTCRNGEVIGADRIILSAGLGAMKLGPDLGFLAPITPERGQVLITEKVPHKINRPSLIARQVDEGGIQIGATNEKLGLNNDVTIDGIAGLAAEAIKTHPFLAKTKLVRSWGALRILSKDGQPIYQQSPTMPGAYMVTCHSAITLAAVHARLLPAWFDGKSDAPDLEKFSEDRFKLS